MAAPDRSWSVAPALLWFTGGLLVALIALDGGVQAVADRFTVRRASVAAGPAFAAMVAGVSETSAAIDETNEAMPVASEVVATVAPVATVATGATIDRSKIHALEDVCLDGAPPRCKRWAMDGFYGAVTASKRGTLGRAVRVSWYGDSVIATDAIPGRLRTLLQGELGDGGPGFVFVVPPHRFCGHEAITRWTGGTWTSHAISMTQTADGLYGVGGSTAETQDGRATFKLTAGTASQVELYYLAQPHGGTASLTADGATVATVETDHETKEAGYALGRVAGGAKKFELTTRGKVRVFGLGLENATGAVVDNLGVVSVNVKSFHAHNPAHFSAELAHRGADLVMIMIGANEAQWLGPTDHATKDYASHYARLLGEIRAARPDATCLVVSPTDQAEAKDDAFPSRPVMPVLVAAQRSAAFANGCAFYSTYAWMGGKGSAEKWYRKGLVGTDFQHLSRKGANKLAEALFQTLMAGYGAYAR